jgi:GH15 family glucan-1,4-alpha-glucosidase
MAAGRPVSRRALVAAGVGTALFGAGTVLKWPIAGPRPPAEFPLYSETVCLGSSGTRTVVPAGRADLVVPGTRILDAAPDRQQLVDAEGQWLAHSAGWTHVTDRWSGLLTDALLDLRVLSDGLPCAVAGWTGPWRYAWPRDSSHVAVALALSGHVRPAVDQLRFMQGVQGRDGWFEARYDVTTRRPPDSRARQFDGAGWVLWATSEIARQPDMDVPKLLHDLRPLITRSCATLARSLDERGLPPISPDYWEVRTTKLTLGIAAPVLTGLSSGVPLLRRMRQGHLADETDRAAGRLNSAVLRRFGDSGFPRELGGTAPDASVALLCPPYSRAPVDAEVRAALTRAQAAMRRPAGGLAPGADWPADGVSWTPQTALFALANASVGDKAGAESLLDWLGAHRTRVGSLPEKVLHDGRPASVAPLAWTAALTVLAIAQLRGATSPSS